MVLPCFEGVTRIVESNDPEHLDLYVARRYLDRGKTFKLERGIESLCCAFVAFTVSAYAFVHSFICFIHCKPGALRKAVSANWAPFTARERQFESGDFHPDSAQKQTG